MRRILLILQFEEESTKLWAIFGPEDPVGLKVILDGGSRKRTVKGCEFSESLVMKDARGGHIRLIRCLTK